MQILRNQAIDLVGVVPAIENDWSVIRIDMKWEIFFDQSGEKNLMPLPRSGRKLFYVPADAISARLYLPATNLKSKNQIP